MELRGLPSVENLLKALREEFPHFPHSLLKTEAQQAIDQSRAALRNGRESTTPLEAARARLSRLAEPSLRQVINATGVVLHTNLGRAPLAPFAPIAGYSNLEYDLATGKRGKRDQHCETLLETLLGSPAIAVNNNAAAVFLVLHEMAAGAEVIVSRGELIEIGDGFRIPDIMRAAGVTLVEVGTTNRTRIEDYAAAVNEHTRLLLRVHPSNFQITGFTAKPGLGDLVQLGRDRRVPVFEDLGSGCLVNLFDEPLARESLAAGVDLIAFSGDKLMGGPQAGYIAGRAELVQRVRRNPMFRALRLDKLIYQSMEQTLRALVLERYDEIPAMRMIRMPAEVIEARAQALAKRIPGAKVIAGESVIGGGATPEKTLPTALIALTGNAQARERALRAGRPPVIARIEKDTLLIDLRTVLPEQEEELAAALTQPHGEGL